jgi:hypothetical protein
MSDLTAVLDELVADAPVERADWDEVLARGLRSAPRRRPRKRIILVLAVIAVLALAGTAVGVGINLLTQQERFHAEMPHSPQRLSPFVEVASGDDWALIAWRSKSGICLDFAIPGNSSYDCDFPVRGAKDPTDALGAGLPIHAVGGFFSQGNLVGGDSKASIYGVAAHEVAAVKVELRDGRIVDAPLYDAPRDLRADVEFFIVRLSVPNTGPGFGPGVGSPVRAYAAYDRDGNLIERVID